MEFAVIFCMEYSSLPIKLFSLLLILAAPVDALVAVEKVTDSSDAYKTAEPALGIYSDFGRWNDAVRLVYDPDNAPDQFADVDHFLELLQQAASEWELVSGIRFLVLDPDGDIPDDDNLSSSFQDGLVRVFWENAVGFAGRAGPEFGPYDYDLGYWPYFDGDIELNNEPGTFYSDESLVRVLVHEMGHLIGLGHSDNPMSVMYANPYNYLRYPRPDDIRAVQVLYGPPDVPINLSRPPGAYIPPATVSDDRLDGLFQPGEGLPNGPAFSVQEGALFIPDVGQVITEITDELEDSLYLRFNLGRIENVNNNDKINIDIEWIITSPSGYLYEKKESTLRCPAGDSCGNRLWNLLDIETIRAMPGEWRVYIIDVSSDPDNPATLLSMPLKVRTSPSPNSPPAATVTTEAGSREGSIIFSLQAEDFDDDEIEVIWHPSGHYDLNKNGKYDVSIVNRISSGDELVWDFDFPGPGVHSLFVELLDDAQRYVKDEGKNIGTAGRGYQTLIRMDVTIPYRSADDVKIYSTQSIDVVNEKVMLGWLAGSNPLSAVTAIGEEGSQAKIYASASANGGISYDTRFSENDNVVIAGKIVPEAADVGHDAEIFVVMYDQDDRLYFRGLNGVFKLWNGKIPDLEPAYTTSKLLGEESFEVYQGSLATGRNRVYIGYRLAAGGPIHVNIRPLKIDVF